MAVLGLLVAACQPSSPLVLERGEPVDFDPGSWTPIDAGGDPPDAGPAPEPIAPLRDIEALALGGGYSCALAADGRVWCWGEHYAPPPRNDFWLTRPPAEDTLAAPLETTGVRGLAAGQNVLCLLLDDGEVDCGDGRRVAGLDALQATAGITHACAVTRRGEVWCWDFGAEDRPARRIEGLGAVTQVAAGIEFTCAREDDGAVSCWSRETDRPLPPPAGLGPVAELSARGLTVCARHFDGTVSCWRPGAGQVAPVPGVSDAVALATGYTFACAVLADGRVSCWGDNDNGQLGRPGPRERGLPAALVEGLTEVRAIAAGWHHACVLTAEGGVRCWGSSIHGQTGHLATHRFEPTPIPGITGAVELRLGGSRACVRDVAGTVTCWGRFHNWPCGPLPWVVPGRHEGRLVHLEWGVVCILRPDGAVACWEDDGEERLIEGWTGVQSMAGTRGWLCARHDDGRVSCAQPRESLQTAVGARTVPGLGQLRSFAGGARALCGVRADETLVCAWPPSSGVDMTVSDLGLLGPVAGVAGADDALCVFRADDAMRCWESSIIGGTLPDPVAPPPGPRPLRSVTGAAGALCVVAADGSPWCRGSNLHGQLRDGTRSRGASDWVRAGGLERVRELHSDGGAVCALTDDGGVLCWGSNVSGLVAPEPDCHHTEPHEVRR